MQYGAIVFAVLGLSGLFWLNWRSGVAPQSGYLYAMPSAQAEASYCIAVNERVREITGGRGPPKLQAFVDEQLRFWRKRVAGQYAIGRSSLARDSQAPGVNEGAHLHLAIQDCGLRAVSFYGARFASMGG